MANPPRRASLESPWVSWSIGSTGTFASGARPSSVTMELVPIHEVHQEPSPEGLSWSSWEGPPRGGLLSGGSPLGLTLEILPGIASRSISRVLSLDNFSIGASSRGLSGVSHRDAPQDSTPRRPHWPLSGGTTPGLPQGRPGRPLSGGIQGSSQGGEIFEMLLGAPRGTLLQGLHPGLVRLGGPHGDSAGLSGRLFPGPLQGLLLGGVPGRCSRVSFAGAAFGPCREELIQDQSHQGVEVSPEEGQREEGLGFQRGVLRPLSLTRTPSRGGGLHRRLSIPGSAPGKRRGWRAPKGCHRRGTSGGAGLPRGGPAGQEGKPLKRGTP